MKQTEYPEDDSRTVPFASVENESRAAETKVTEPSSGTDSLSGTRNLAWGVISLLLAAIGLWLGLKHNRAAVAQSLIASLGAFGVLWLLYNFRLLRQRNGLFLAVALVALLGTAVPFIVAGLHKLDHLADERLVAKTEDAPEPSAPVLPIPTSKNVPPAPQAPELPAQEQPKEKPAPQADDGVVREFIAPEPDPKAGKLIRIKQDSLVNIQGRKWRLKAGQIYQFKGM